MGKLDTDVPYLEPLLIHLRNDVELEKYFSKKDFYALPKADLGDLEDAIKNDCPAPRSVWIFPGNNQNQIATRTPNCGPKMLHNFNIVITYQCIRKSFEFKVDADNKLYLDGQFMELSAARKAVKKSITRFNKTLNIVSDNMGFDYVSWVSDEMLYPDDATQFLISNSVYQTIIF